MENKKSLKLTTKHVVAIGIGAALYAATSMIAIPIGPNTSLRPAIALLMIFGAIFGPIVGFLVGFIGHALNDAVSYGSIWWSWVFMSAFIGLGGGLIGLKSDFDVMAGKMQKVHIGLMYLYGLIGVLLGSAVSYVGDVFVYGEPADKTLFQLVLAIPTNYIVIAALGIPVVIALAKQKSKASNLEELE